MGGGRVRQISPPPPPPPCEQAHPWWRPLRLCRSPVPCGVCGLLLLIKVWSFGGGSSERVDDVWRWRGRMRFCG